MFARMSAEKRSTDDYQVLEKKKSRSIKTHKTLFKLYDYF
jgi:hypothetical protein